MLRARSLQWICLTIIFLSTTAFAQTSASQNDCDWYCWVEHRLDVLEQQVAKLTKLLYSGGSNSGNGPSHTQHSQYTTSTTKRYSTTTFGTPYVTTTAKTSYVAKPTSTSTKKIVTVSTTGYTPRPTDVEPHDGYRAIGYFGNWDIYARKFFPQNIPADKLTHVLYSFADNKDNGTVFFTDTYADTDIHYAGDSWSESGNNVYGAVKQLQLLKAKNRNLKVMLSIGGWTYTNTNKHMDAPMSTATGRQKFADSCVAMVRDYGFDGIDVDWEYPQNVEQGGQLLDLLKAIRKALDGYANTLIYEDGHGSSEKPHFELSIAAPAGESNYKNMPLRQISEVVDFINLMAYDYAGSWDKTSGHAQNLYKSRSNPASTPFNTYDVLNLGMPIYGRAFTNTAGMGQSYNGNGKGSWEGGVYDWKDLPLNGAQVYYDQEAGGTYSYDNSTGLLVSFDTVDMALKKTDWLKKTKLGGAMWWEVSGDRYDGSGLIDNVVAALKGKDGSGIQQKSNWLRYPDSKFDNIKALGG
ncbi:glycoside hydrolase superfamily [Boeremia exigua]|uniref:glycoside hydrolase superfamily n=1 Tax=Boeremia exigua TaxID=749465 RepID=UPI001E8D966E|nr:glycoside hydrolase superfamily [Boeremia exigua]KAH6637638.1 glycoside hydrolase superfamily [Boeremia exigua]